MHILDVGCGPGSITLDFAALVPRGRAVGIDDGPDVIEKARSLATDRGVQNVDFEVGDANHLPFPDDAFDIVHGHQILQHIPDPVGALREWKRVTKPGGVVACRESDWSTAAHYPETAGVRDFQVMYEQTARAMGGEPLAGRCLISWALKAGFRRESVAASASVWSFASGDERRVWGEMWSDRLLNTRLKENAMKLGYASQQDLEDMAEEWRGWAEREDGWYTLTHGEIVCRV